MMPIVTAVVPALFLLAQSPGVPAAESGTVSGRVSFERGDASLVELLETITRLAGIGLEVEAGIDDPILEGASARDAPWWEVVDDLLAGTELVGEWDGSVLRVRAREQGGLRLAPEVARGRLGPVDWEAWPSGRDQGLSPRGLSLAQVRGLLRNTVESGEWYGVPYRACSLGNGTVWIAEGEREPVAARWSADLVRPLGASICRGSAGVGERCLLLRRNDDGAFLGVDAESGEARWRFTVASSQQACPAVLAQGSGG